MKKKRILKKYGFKKSHSAYIKENYELRFGEIDRMSTKDLKLYLEKHHDHS